MMFPITETFLVAALWSAYGVYIRYAKHDNEDTFVERNKTCLYIPRPYYGQGVYYGECASLFDGQDGNTTGVKNARTVTVDITRGSTPVRTEDADEPVEEANPNLFDPTYRLPSSRIATVVNWVAHLISLIVALWVTTYSALQIRDLRRQNHGQQSIIEFLERGTDGSTVSLNDLGGHLEDIEEKVQDVTDITEEQTEGLKFLKNLIDTLTQYQQGLWDVLRRAEVQITNHSEQIRTTQAGLDRFSEEIIAAGHHKEKMLSDRIKELADSRKELVRKTEEQDTTVKKLLEALKEERDEKEQVTQYLRGHRFTNTQANDIFQEAIETTTGNQMAPLLIGYMTALGVQLSAASETVQPGSATSSPVVFTSPKIKSPESPHSPIGLGLKDSELPISGG